MYYYNIIMCLFFCRKVGIAHLFLNQQSKHQSFQFSNNIFLVDCHKYFIHRFNIFVTLRQTFKTKKNSHQLKTSKENYFHSKNIRRLKKIYSKFHCAVNNQFGFYMKNKDEVRKINVIGFIQKQCLNLKNKLICCTIKYLMATLNVPFFFVKLIFNSNMFICRLRFIIRWHYYLRVFSKFPRFHSFSSDYRLVLDSLYLPVLLIHHVKYF